MTLPTSSLSQASLHTCLTYQGQDRQSLLREKRDKLL